MPSGLIIRPATVEDTAAIQQVALRSWHEAYDEILGADQIDAIVGEWYAQKRLVEDDITVSSRAFLVANTKDNIVGFAEAVPDDPDQGIAELYRIYVDPAHWGRGIGQSLLDEIQETLRERGFETLRLSVFAENTVGVGFYESTGFERVDTEYSERFDARQYIYAKEI